MSTITGNDQKDTAKKNNEGTASEHNHVMHVVAVMSGKGGVGKSFVTGLLASALAREGFQVGILDADITGPSIPMLFGLHGPVHSGQYGIQPLLSRTGIKVMSMNLLLPGEDTPVIWRGPLISKAIKQLWEDVMWGELDYLLVDLPPGTSDAALTIMQSLPVKGVIMVTTPQGLAAMIVNKAVHMAQNIGVPIIGVVENMAYYHCPDTGKKHFIFGQCHGASVTNTAQAPMLAQIPLDPFVAELCDFGKVEEVVLDESQALIDAFVQSLPIPGKNRLSNQAAPPAEISGEQSDEKILQDDSTDEDAKLPVRKTFSDKARQLIDRKENLGCFENPDARGKFRGLCGDSMQIDLQLAGEEIQEARFMTDGCGATMACGSMVTNLARAKTLAEAMRITPEELLTALEGLPQDREHCADLAVNTLREAVKNAMRGH